MKRFFQIIFLILLPLLLLNPLIQKIPLFFRGNILYFVIFLLFYQDKKNGLFYSIYCGLLWDIFTSPAIGYYIATYLASLLIFSAFLKWIPYPSLLSISISVASTHLFSMGFLYFLVFFLHNHTISSSPCQLIYSSLGTFIISAIILSFVSIDESYRRGIS